MADPGSGAAGKVRAVRPGLSAAHGNCPASLAGWITACLAYAQGLTTLGVFTAHSTKHVPASLRGRPSHEPVMAAIPRWREQIMLVFRDETQVCK